MKVALLLVASSAWAATIPVTVMSVTPTQVVVTYVPTIAGACTLELSESVSYSPVVNDVNTSLFSGSNSDLRTGDLVVGKARQVVLGQRIVGVASDGKYYSRALQAYTPHYGRVTCGSDTGTFSFQTSNPPLGNTASDVPQFDSASFGNYAQPTIDFASQDTTYIDAFTGVQLKRVTHWQVADDTNTNVTFSAAFDPISAWTTPNNILTTGGSFATYAGAGTTAAYLFLQTNLAINGANGYGNKNNYDDLRLHINGSGDNGTASNRTVSVCLSTDHGQTCASATEDLVFPQTTPAVVNYPASDYPHPILANWTIAGATPVISPNMVKRTGDITANGTTVTWVDGALFDDMVAGDTFTDNSATLGCPSNICTLTSVTNAQSVQISTTVSGPVSAAFTAQNFGWKIWKKTATGSVSLNTAKYDITNDTPFGMPDEGSIEGCSSVIANTTIDRNGTPLGYTQPGYLCTQMDQFQNARLFWHASGGLLAGEVRYIDQLVGPAVGSPAADIFAYTSAMCAPAQGAEPLGNFSPTDPNVLYCAGNKTGSPATHDVMMEYTYNVNDPTWGNYKEWDNGYNFSTSGNPAGSWLNVTKASLFQDLDTQAAVLIPGFSNVRYGFGPGEMRSHYFSLMAKTTQDGLGYFFRFDTNTNTITTAHDTWTTAPVRWGGIHGISSIYTAGPASYLTIFIAALRSASATGIGQFQMIPQTINGSSDTSLTTNQVSSSTCETLGANPIYGATGFNCIAVTTDHMPYDPTPSVSDLTTGTAPGIVPDPTNTTPCPGSAQCWTILQTAQEGDYLIDVTSNGAGEQFRIVKKFSDTSYIWQRFVTPTCASPGGNSHSNGWIAIMFLGTSCGANVFFVDTSGTVTADDPVLAAGHQDILTDASTDNGCLFEVGYVLRGCPPPVSVASEIGQQPNFLSPGSYSPQFNGSANSLTAGAIQSHPSARQHTAAPPEFRWALDGRPYGLGGGGLTALFYNVISTTTQTGVYKVGPAWTGPGNTGLQLSALDRKNLSLQVWAGRYLLQDKSGPGSTLLTADTWKYCVADSAGECFATSSAGDVFMNVPQAQIAGLCITNLEVNTPCWVSSNAVSPHITQAQLDKPDPRGNNWRVVSNFFNGLGYTDNFWNARSLPDASWAYTIGTWVNGIRSDIYTVKLSPWPVNDTVQRNTFVPVTIRFTTPSTKVYKVLFGYDTNLYCTTRQEQCATMGTPTGPSPFQWVSEAQPGTTCNGPCTLTIPAIGGRVLYYAVQNVTDGITGPMQVMAVN